MKRLNTRRILDIALHNVLQNSSAVTFFQKALVKELSKVPTREKDVPAHRRVFADFCAQVCSTGGEFNQTAPRCLEHRTDYTGRWMIQNRDLRFMRQLAMWTGRYEADTGGGFWADEFATKLGRKVGFKRMHQAWQRFQTTGLTQEHCWLLEKAGWFINTWRGDGESLYMDGKHPWGDSFKELTIYQICGWELPRNKAEEVEMSNAHEERAWNIFDELAFAAPAAATRAADSFL